MNLISIAQQCGDISGDLYSKYAGMGPIEPPAMSGVDQMVAKMQEATQNPFTTNGYTGEKPPMGPPGGRPPALGIPAGGMSPHSSQVVHFSIGALPCV